MKKRLVFMHHNYPAQFGPITQFLQREYDVEIAFFSQHASKPPAPGIRYYTYQPITTGHEQSPYFFSRYFEQECASAHGVFNALQASQFEPDVLIGHVAFGNMGLMHVAYPEVPRIGFFELFYDPTGKRSEIRPEFPVPKPNQMRVPLRNATQLIELEYCTKGYSPTPFQRSTFPAVYQPKLSVLFDGIDTHQYQPGPVSDQSELPRSWPTDAPIITYVSRGLEALRGFDIFMEAAYRLSQKRQDVHFVIAGNPKTHYGSEMMSIKAEHFKAHVLQQHPFDLNRFHFLNWISESALVDLFRLSAAHVYWTVPFTLSWSLFQAMSTGCLILGSNTEPVQDAVIPGVNGLLIEPYDVDAWVEAMEAVLDQPQQFQPLREVARHSMVSQFSFDVCLPRLADFFLNPA